MNLPAALPLTDAVFALTLVLLLLVPLAIAGVALINTGLGRSRSAAQSLLGNLAILAVIGHRLCAGWRYLGRYVGHCGPHPAACGQALELARRRTAGCWADSARPLSSPNSRCSLNFWPSPWPLSFRGARERTACA